MSQVQNLTPFIEARLAPIAGVCSRTGCVEPTVKGSRFCDKHLEESFQEKKLVLPAQGAKSYIYAIGPHKGNSVKIGRAKNVHARLSHIQAGNPEELSILGAIVGLDFVETVLHIAFEDYRIRGEWFRREGAVEDLIDYMRRGAASKIWDMVRVRCDVTPVNQRMITPQNAHEYVKRDYEAVPQAGGAIRGVG